MIIQEIAHRKQQGEREELCKLEMLIVAEKQESSAASRLIYIYQFKRLPFEKGSVSINS